MYIVGKCRILFVQALGTGGKANVKNKLLWLILQRAHYPDSEPTSLCSYSLMLCVIITRDGNEYPVNRVLARTSDYRIPKSVFGYSENFFL